MHRRQMSDNESDTLRKVDRRVFALCAGVIFISYMDRGNLSYVARDLCNVLDLNHKQYGVGVSLFYLGYIPIQFISNTFLRRLGAPAWLSFIMLVWGCICSATSLIQTTAQFYALRFFLGVAEGGTFPGVYYFLSTFYPLSHQTGAYSIVMGAMAIAMPISAPISAALLSMDGLLGLEGWRYVFVGEGLIPVAFACVLYFFLPESPESATFLEADEQQWLLSKLSDRGTTNSQRSSIQVLKEAARNKTWWLLNVAGMFLNGVFNVLMFWIALIIHDALHGEDEEDSGTCGTEQGNGIFTVLLTAIPYTVAGVLCFGLHWLGKNVGIRNRPRFASFMYWTASLLMVSWIGTRSISFVAGFMNLTFAIGTQYPGGGCIVALVMSQFDASARSTCISISNIILGVGALVLPPIVGALVDAHGYVPAVLLVGLLIFSAGILVSFASEPLANRYVQIGEIEKHHADGILEAEGSTYAKRSEGF